MPGPAEQPRAARPLARLAALYGTAAAVLAADQLTKYLVVHHLEGRAPVRIVGSFVELRYTTNSGGAFSLLTGAPVFFVLAAVVIIGGIIHAARRTQGLPVLLAHLGHRVGGVLFLLQPAVQDAQDLVAGCRCRGGAAGEQVSEEVLKVGAGGVAQAHATGAQERLDLMQVLQVVAHGALGAVGGAQVPLEGAEEPIRRLLVHAPERSEVS
jgi:hypothetical protein